MLSLWSLFSQAQLTSDLSISIEVGQSTSRIEGSSKMIKSFLLLDYQIFWLRFNCFVNNGLITDKIAICWTLTNWNKKSIINSKPDVSVITSDVWIHENFNVKCCVFCKIICWYRCHTFRVEIVGVIRVIRVGYNSFKLSEILMKINIDIIIK